MSAEPKTRAENAGPDTASRWRLTAVRTSFQILLAICVLAATLWILHRVGAVLLLLALSVLFAYMVAPIVAFFRRPIGWLKGRVMPLSVAIWAAYLLVFGVATAAALLVWPVLNTQLAELRAEAPAYITRIQATWQHWKAGQTRMLPRDVRAAINGIVDEATSGALDWARTDLLPRVGGWLMSLPWLILVPIFAFFFLRDAELFRKRALKVFLERKLRWRGDLFFEEVSRSLAAYVRALVFGSLVVAAVCSTGFALFGVTYPVLFGVAAGLLEFLPMVGPFVIAVIVVALVALQSLPHALGVAAFLLVVRIAQDYVIYPKLVGRELPLHPMAIILAILCGAEIGGVAGVLLAVPTLAILTVAYRHWRAHQAAEVPRPAAV